MGETFYIVQQCFADHAGARSEFSTLEEAKEFADILRMKAGNSDDFYVDYRIYEVKEIPYLKES